ncbi:MAG: hypothetical protein WCA81_03370 [Rhizomicrobium sp.]
MNGGGKIFGRVRLKLCFAAGTAEKILHTLMNEHITFRTRQELVGRHFADRIMTEKLFRIVLELRCAPGRAEEKFLAVAREDISFGARGIGVWRHPADGVENLDGRDSVIFHG